ncbi:MAG: hypothetical protein ACOC8F_03515 [Planctomycetota bacterium]
MAEKEQISPLAQHVEKGVLGVCVLILLSLALTYGTGTTTVELNGSEVPLGKLGEEVLRAAERRAQAARNAGLEDEQIQDVTDELVALLAEPFPPGLVADWPETALAPPLQRLPVGPQFGPLPEIARVEPPAPEDVVVSIDVLQDHVPRPTQPNANVVRELRNLPVESERAPEKIVAHVAGTYAVMQLLEQWRRDLRKMEVPPRFAVLSVRVQRSELQLDGTWNEPRTVTTVTSSRRGQGLEAPPEPEELLGAYDGSEESRREIRRQMDRGSILLERRRVPDEETGEMTVVWTPVVEQRGAEDAILDALQPPYVDVYAPITGQWYPWRIHLPETSVSRAERARLEAEAGPDAEDERPGLDVRRGPTRRTPTRRRTPRRAPDYSEIPPEELEMYMEEYDRPPPEYERRPRPTPTPRPQPTRPEEQIKGPEPTPVPTLARQLDSPDGTLLVWFHDTDNLQAGRTYRWRYRLVLANPLLTYDTEVRDPAEAQQRFIETAWSAWSQEASAPEVAEIFVTGGSTSLQTAYVTVFRQVRGQTVEARFSVAPGQQIGAPQSKDLLDPLTGERIRRDVDFATGAVVVARDLDKPIRRKGRTTDTIEVTYVDAKGQLHRAIHVNHLRNPDRKELYETLRREAERAADRGAGTAPE